MPSTPTPSNPYQVWSIPNQAHVGRGLDGVLRVIVEASYTPHMGLRGCVHVGTLSVLFVDGTRRVVELSESQLIEMVGRSESGVRIEPDETMDAIAQLIA